MILLARLMRGARLSCLGALIGSVSLAGSLGSQPAAAQALTSLEFSFSNPGARSLGFGGSFVALADDVAAGIGVALRRLQIDFGVDLSERIDTASLSVIYSFGG